MNGGQACRLPYSWPALVHGPHVPQSTVAASREPPLSRPSATRSPRRGERAGRGARSKTTMDGEHGVSVRRPAPGAPVCSRLWVWLQPARVPVNIERFKPAASRRSGRPRCCLALGWLWGGFGVALGWLWGAYAVAINTHWGGFDVALRWLFIIHHSSFFLRPRAPDRSFRDA